MRKKVHVVKEDFYEALTLLGYSKTKDEEARTEWRRFHYHLIVHEKNSLMNLRLHRDVRVPIPPFHKAVQKAPDIARELSKILDAYKARRRGK